MHHSETRKSGVEGGHIPEYQPGAGGGGLGRDGEIWQVYGGSGDEQYQGYNDYRQPMCVMAGPMHKMERISGQAVQGVDQRVTFNAEQDMDTGVEDKGKEIVDREVKKQDMVLINVEIVVTLTLF